MTAPLHAAAARPPDPWDPVVRLTHWIIALVVLVNAVITRGGSPLHVWAGWIGLALLVLRLVWGLVGPAEARFSAFPPHPAAAFRHLAELLRGRPRDYPSHNPAGALMAYAIWTLLAIVMATGLVMTGGRTPSQVSDEQAIVNSGDWSALVKEGEAGEDDGDEDGIEEAAEEMHEVAANLLLLLVVLHVAGVVFESRASRRNLLRPMLTGSPGARRR